MIPFQALEEYHAQNLGKDTLFPDNAWRIPEDQICNYLCEIADLIRIVAAGLVKLEELGMHKFGAIQTKLPVIKSAEEIARWERDEENRIFREAKHNADTRSTG